MLLAPGAVRNGIDYVNVAAGQTQLSVHFLNTVALLLWIAVPVGVLKFAVKCRSFAAGARLRPLGLGRQ